jgi:hypothetical protein
VTLDFFAWENLGPLAFVATAASEIFPCGALLSVFLHKLLEENPAKLLEAKEVH